MTKSEAMELVQAHRMTAVFGLVLRESCNPNLTASVIRGKSFGFEHQGIVAASLGLDRLAQALEDVRERQILLNNLSLTLKHTLVRDSFEIVKTYAEDSGQDQKFKAWPPYNFARFIRNTLSHRDGGVLHRWTPANLSVATWRHRRLTPSDVGTPLALEPAEYVQLQDDLYHFLRDHLI
jgi:hypothetical protein